MLLRSSFSYVVQPRCTRRAQLAVRRAAAAEGDLAMLPKPTPRPVADLAPESASVVTTPELDPAPTTASHEAIATPPSSESPVQAVLSDGPAAEAQEPTAASEAGAESSAEKRAPGAKKRAPGAKKRALAGRRSRVSGRTATTGSKGPSSKGKDRLYRVVFLEESPANFDKELTKVFQEHTSQGKTVILRSLGRQGTAGALKFVLALREAGRAAEEPLDAMFQLHPMDELQDFGRPIMMFVNVKKGRFEMPRPGPGVAAYLSPNAKVPFRRQLEELLGKLCLLKRRRGVIRLDMVGTDNIYRGLSLVNAARIELGDEGAPLFFVPELVAGSTPMVRLFVCRPFQRRTGTDKKQEGDP